jgi:hypothetical protein
MIDWRQVLTLYVRQQRDRVAVAYAYGSIEFDGCMDGLRILELLAARDLAAIALCVIRRRKAEAGMLEDGLGEWTYAHFRRHQCATLQVFSGGEVALAAVGGNRVSERAVERCAELIDQLTREGKEAA